MDVTVDRVGRIVIPKSLRTALGIGPDTRLEIMADGTGLRLEPSDRQERSVGERDGFPILGDVIGTTLTDDDVRRLRDEFQR